MGEYHLFLGDLPLDDGVTFRVSPGSIVRLWWNGDMTVLHVPVKPLRPLHQQPRERKRRWRA